MSPEWGDAYEECSTVPSTPVLILLLHRYLQWGCRNAGSQPRSALEMSDKKIFSK